ncbi:MAG TPA: hypothetical protein VEA61_09065 [Allosphingosinicella sp.]|nr:hypothetical protein [Allosphingosinicella sp.]
MRPFAALVVAVLGMTAAVSAPVEAGPREREQAEAFRGTREGRIIPLRAIEARIVPQMRGFAYIGPEYYAELGRYRLKFLRGQRVVWVDVDARTGEVIGRSGF